MFKAFTLEEVKEFAKAHGFEEVTIERYVADEDELGNEIYEWEVSFGVEYTEEWRWAFEDLDGVAYEYEHMHYED